MEMEIYTLLYIREAGILESRLPNSIKNLDTRNWWHKVKLLKTLWQGLRHKDGKRDTKGNKEG